MDFTAEEELCQQAYEVWLHYACPACDGTAPPALRVTIAGASSSSCDGPCSVLPAFVSSYAIGDTAEAFRQIRPGLR